MSNDFPVVDGIAPSWADIIVRLSPIGAPLLELGDIKAINSGTTVEYGEQRAGGRLMKRTTGSESSEASITLYRSGYQKLLRGLKSAAPSRGNQRLVALVHFGIEVQHTPPGDVEVYLYRLKGCRLKGRTLNGSEGDDADTVEVPLSVVQIADVIDGEEVVMV